jgi:hypothetical protein
MPRYSMPGNSPTQLVAWLRDGESKKGEAELYGQVVRVVCDRRIEAVNRIHSRPASWLILLFQSSYPLEV